MNTLKLTALACAVALTGCGGGSSSDGGSDAPAENARTGVFTDSAVAGINYRTSPGNRSGSTNALGEYDYVDGDTVTFMIGGIPLPSVPATGRVTPADMASDEQPDQVTNILRLLQSLDQDGDPDNGITIPGQTHTDLANAQLDLAQPAASFETAYDSEVRSQTNSDLVSAEDAETHFNESQQADLRGSWVFVEPAGESSNGKGPDGEEINVLTFMHGGRYIVAHKYGNDDQGAATAEWGFYDWNPQSGDVSFEVVGDSDASGGICGDDTFCSDTINLVGDELVLGSEEEATTAFQAVKNEGNDYVGAWYLPEDVGFNVLTILDGSHYVVAHSDNQDVYTGDNLTPTSSEWGTYSITNDQFQVNGVETETDGPGGLYDASNSGAPGASATVEATPYGDLGMAFDAEDVITFGRIGRFSVELRDLVGNRSVAVVERSEQGFEEGMSADFTIELVGEGDSADVSLNGDGSGTMTFSPGTQDQETSTIDAPWTTTDSGALRFTESLDDESTGSWTMVKVNNGKDVLVDFRHVDGTTESLLGFFISDFVLPAEPVSSAQ